MTSVDFVYAAKVTWSTLVISELDRPFLFIYLFDEKILLHISPLQKKSLEQRK